MAFETPRYSRRQVKLAGESLRAVPIVSEDVYRALPIISNWRAAHAYPLNTFQATLRKKLNALGLHGQEVVVGQRLKRLPSIAAKLDRFHTMALDRMQDIAGLRAVLPGVKKLQLLAHSYYDASRFTHELRQVHDYVAAPKPDGYRSIHLVYRYNNPRAPAYEGLHVEQSITALTLRKPASGELRGLKLVDLINMDVTALITLLPRISSPTLTAADAAAMDLPDLTQCAIEVASFFVTRAQLETLESPPA